MGFPARPGTAGRRPARVAADPQGAGRRPRRQAGCRGRRGRDQVWRLARWLTPVAASPATPLETIAAVDALRPSLMPRTTRQQGLAMGLSVLGMRAKASVVETLT